MEEREICVYFFPLFAYHFERMRPAGMHLEGGDIKMNYEMSL